MVYEFTKSDEGKYLFYSFWLEDNYCETYNYVIKVTKKVAAYRSFFFVQGLRSDFIKKYPDICRWRYEVTKVNDNNFLDSTACSYPLRLVLLDCPYPEKGLTKKERSKMMEFEQGKNV